VREQIAAQVVFNAAGCPDDGPAHEKPKDAGAHGQPHDQQGIIEETGCIRTLLDPVDGRAQDKGATSASALVIAIVTIPQIK